MEEVVFPHNRGELKAGNVTYRSLYDNRLSKDDLEEARLTLGETEEVKSASLRQLRDMLKSNKDFCFRLDDDYLLRYLRFRKYNVQKAYTVMRKFYEFRKERPEYFVIPSNIDFLLSRDILKGLPYRDKGGHPLLWVDTNQWKFDEMTADEIFLIATVYADTMTMIRSHHINGIVSIWDLGGLTASHIYRYAYPSILRTFVKILQSKYPWRIKQIIGFNCNPVLRRLYYVFNFLLSKKIVDRIVLMGSDIEELHKYINPQLLPKVYGGCIETSECSIQQFVKDNLPYIKYERSFGSSTKD